jgi:hypothetical protein
MKNPIFLKSFLLLFLISGLFSACASIGNIDIQKRHYRKGFYINPGKTHLAGEKSADEIPETSAFINEKRNDPFPKEDSNSQIVEPVKISQDYSSKNKAAEKIIQPEIKKTKSEIVKSKELLAKSLVKKASVPGWLSDTATIFLFVLVCLVIPPYWFYFLGFVYIFAKNKKKATFFMLGGIVTTAMLVFTIALLIAGSSLLLPVYLITLGLGLFALTFALIRFFSL